MSNPLTEYYVDPAIAADSGAGTIGDPYGDLQYALNNITRDTIDGDRINIKAGTAESLTGALSLTTYGTPAFTAPLVFQGYTSAAGDGGKAAIDCNANTAITWSGTGIAFRDIDFTDGPTTQFIALGNFSSVFGCSFIGAAGHGILINGVNCSVIGNRFEDLGNATHDAIYTTADNHAIWFNYIRQQSGSSNTMRAAINTEQNNVSIYGNIISLDKASTSTVGILLDSANSYSQSVIGNTILAVSTSTGSGISVTSSNATISLNVINNYVEGFAGTGGVGFECTVDSSLAGIYAANAAYNNATNYSWASEHFYEPGGNETLSGTGLAKSGADTYANRFTYFAPISSGGMLTDGYPEVG